MADSDFLHTAAMLKAALPYVDAGTQSTMDLLLKFYEFMHLLRGYRSGAMSACGFENKKIDLEAMLNSIRPLSNEKEREMIDKLLSIFTAKRMFEMYNTYMSAMKAMQEFNDFSQDSSEKDTADNVAKNFSGFDFSSIFGNSAPGSYDSQTADKDTPDDGHITGPDTDKVTNDGMLDMMKSMIPPEQMDTFENLRMLFQSMSYDDNNKSDQSKES